MRRIGRSWRRITPMLAATMLGLSGIGLATASPAAAVAPNPNVTLTVTTQLPGASANTMYVGQKANYAVTVKATDALTGVSFTDTLPADLTLDTTNPGTGWTCLVATPLPPGSPSTLTCQQSNPLAAGASSTATIGLTPKATTTLPSVIFNPLVSAATPPLSNVALASGPATVPIAAAADLSLGMTVPTAAHKYTLTVTNAGPSAAAAPITITQTLPAGITLPVAFAAGTGWTCTATAAPPQPSANGPTISCLRTTSLPAPLVPNDTHSTTSITITFGLGAGSNGRITTPATVISPTFDPAIANNTAAASQGAVPYGTAADPGPCGPASAAVPPVRTCKLVAAPATVTAPVVGAVPVWGFGIDDGKSPVTVPGPTLIANEGETLQLVVRNALPTHTSTDSNVLAVTIPGMTTSHPDDTGVASGSTTSPASPSYNWANLRPGTYLYEAGPTINGARQVAMGLSGLLIVRPKNFSPTAMTLFDPPATAPTGTACTSTNGSSQFTAESLVQVTEMSSEFHKAPFTSTMSPGGGNGPVNNNFTPAANNPGGSPDRAQYAPDVFLINGKAYPNTAMTAASGTDCLALHYVDMGMLEKSFGVLGRRQIVMADDSNALAHPQNLATKYLNPGEEVDAVVDMTGAVPGSLFPVMDFGRHFHNGSGTALSTTATNTGMTLGGQLALLQVGGTAPANLNPTMDLVGLDHNTVAVDKANTFTPAQLNVTVNGIARAGGTISGGQWTIDNIPPIDALTGVPAPPPPGTVSGTFTTTPFAIPSASLAPLTNGDHIIWVRVQNGTHWSDPPSGVVFTLDRLSGGANPNGGPILTNLSLNPSVTNGTTPNSIPGSIGRTDTAIVNAGSPTVTDNQITAADAGQALSGTGIPPGAVVGNVNAGNSFQILVGGVPTNATANAFTVNIGVPGVPAQSADIVIDGTATAALSDWTITGFTWSIDGTSATHTVAVAGSTGSPVEITDTIPQSVVLGLPGDHTYTVSVVATETQGTSTRTSNPVTVRFVKTATGPAATVDTIDPNPAGPASDFLGNANYYPSVRIRGKFTDALASVSGGEMFFLPVVGGNVVGLDGSNRPGADGTGVQVTPDSGLWTAPAGSTVPYLVDIPSAEFNGLPQGKIRIYVHGKDAAGQWNQGYAIRDLILDKTPPVILDSTTTPSGPDPSVSNGGGGQYTLNFSAVDPATVPPPCTVNGTQITPQGCGDVATSKVTAVEWIISDPNGIDIPGANDFTVILPSPADGPGPFSVDISGGPKTAGVYPAGDQVHFRIRDGAGNWTNWRLVNIP